MTPAEENIYWIEKYCYIPEGVNVGKKVVLRDWQKDIIYKIYDNPHKTRRAILSFARKNAKTALSAMLLLLHIAGPRYVRNSQLYSAAQSRKQAALIYSYAAKMVRMNAELHSYIVLREHAKQIACPELGTIYESLSAEASTAYGLSPVFMIHDELGQVRGETSELYEALETASGAHQNPLSIIISTQAQDDGDLLSKLIDDALVNEDKRTVVVIYSADESLDPFSEKAIKQANPAYGDFLNADEILQNAESAKRLPSREMKYRNLHLNQRCSSSKLLISKRIWDANAGEIDLDVFRQFPVYGGLDLSSKNDLTACALICDDDLYTYLLLHFFSPEIGLRERIKRDRVPYDVWKDEGYLTLTPGATVDYGFVAKKLLDLYLEYEYESMGYDRWRIELLKNEVQKVIDSDSKYAGIQLPLIDYGQGFKDMSPAIDSFEEELTLNKVRHGDNPILRWNAANAVIDSDAAGNRKLNKTKSSGRIDGMVAVTMAFGLKAVATSNIITYEKGALYGG